MSSLCPAEGCGSEGEWWKEIINISSSWVHTCKYRWFHLTKLDLAKCTWTQIERLFATGVSTSPNYPGNYPSNLEKTETILVEQGLILSLQFTAFDIESDSTCRYDHLTITDGDGTTLMEKSCGSTLPAAITSTSNMVNLVFNTDSITTKTGWSLSWSTVTPGS